MNKFILAIAASLLTSAAIAAPVRKTIEHRNDQLGLCTTQVFPMAEDADMAATDGKVSVKCNLIYDAEQMTPLYVFYTQGRGLYPTPLRHRLTSTTLSMTPGKYCIYAQFTKYNPNLSDNGQYDFFTPITLVLKEVEITEDTTLDFDVATAVNLVRFEAINRNDEPLILPLYKDKKLDYSQSNVRSTWRSSSLFHPVYGEVHTLTGNDGYRMEDGRAGNHAFNFMINDVSDDYTFVQTVLTESLDNGYEMSLIGLNSKGLPKPDAIISNTAESFVKYEQDYVPTLIYPSLKHERYNCGIQTYAMVNNLLMIGYNYVSEKMNPYFYVSCLDFDNDNVNVSFLSTLKFFEEDYFITGDQTRTQSAILACPIMSDKTGLKHSSSFHTHFDTPVGTMPGIPGDNVPVNALKMHNVNSVITYAPTFNGRWGEVRQADDRTLTAVVKYNGETKCDDYSQLADWAAEWAKDSHEPGIMTATFVSENTEVDGIKGRNTVEVTYNEASYDRCAPVLQFLTVKDKDGVYTDRLSDTKGACLEFTAGDFNGSGGTYGQCQDVFDWKVEVAPHGTEDFVKIPATRIIDMMGTNIWGVYNAKLDSWSTMSQNGLFDVIITLADYADAKSVQTIAPAFHVSSLSGIEDALYEESAAITAIGREIVVTGMENPQVKVISLSGSTVLEGSGSKLNATSLPSGIYVVKATDNSATSTKKVVIR